MCIDVFHCFRGNPEVVMDWGYLSGAEGSQCSTELKRVGERVRRLLDMSTRKLDRQR